MPKNQKSELLLPVGNMEMCLAAIHNGADAIYVGMPGLNARGRTVDLSIEALKEMIDLCHLYGVKVNLAFNVVIFQNEMEKALELLKEVLPLGPDALIVQDLGLARLVRTIAPTQVLHASTQMTVTNFEAISLLEDLSIKRFVLGREVSLVEMGAIKEKTDKELEVFVHGALCVAYSGQCFTSESIGGRSANRGQCAQSCRLEYDLLVNGKKLEMKEKYLVSPQDLCGIAQIPELLDLGIESFKVEGRLKTPEYVAAAGRSYREAIDRGEGFKEKDLERARREMGVTYSRGFFSGWLHGVDHQKLVEGTYGAHRGVEIGEVVTVKGKSVVIKTQESSLESSLESPLKKGDGLLFAGFLRGKKSEVGGKIYEITSLGSGRYECQFDKNVDLKNIVSGFKVYLNHDALVFKKLKQSYTDKAAKKRIPLWLKIEGRRGEPLKLWASDGVHTVELLSAEKIPEAQKNPTTKEEIKGELGALANTCFIAKDIEVELYDELFIHQKILKELRREFTSALMNKRVKRDPPPVGDFTFGKRKNHLSKEAKPKLNILLRESDQAQDLLEFYSAEELLRDTLGIVYLDYEFGKGYGESVKKLKEKGIKVGIATTRILKPNEYHNFKVIERARPDVILCRNLGAVHYFQGKDFSLKGDFSLNVTNSLTAGYLKGKNLQTLCASYDLNAEQLFDLASEASASSLEVTIHQYMPSFHMEHCVFAAFLSEGSSFRDCGKPCEKERIELRDQYGHYHHIKADQECRNTMFNAIPQSGAMLIPSLIEKGVQEFRFEALDERKEILFKKIQGYCELLANTDPKKAQELANAIGVLEKYGLSDGSHRDREYKDRKKDQRPS